MINIRKYFDEEAKCVDARSSSEPEDSDESSDTTFIEDESTEDGENECTNIVKRTTKQRKTENINKCPSQIKAKRGRPRKQSVQQKSVIIKPPGDSAYPTNDFSLTVTKTKQDVGLDALEAVAVFIENHCVKGGVSTEVGQRAFHLHLQSVFRIHWPTGKLYIQKLSKIIKAALPSGGKQYKILIKPLRGGQNFSSMIGYITKDQGQAHYQVRTHNISRQELSFGRRDHDALLTSFDDQKKIINIKNFFNETYKFNMRCMHPAIVPIQYCLLYMLQSGSYILSPDFISVYKKIDLHEAEILWHMVHYPSHVCLSDVLTLLFNPLSYGRKVSQRYFVAGMHTLPATQSMSTPEESTTEIHEEASSSNTPNTGSIVNRLLRIARSGSARAPIPILTQPEFIELPADEGVQYIIDRTPAAANENMLHTDPRTRLCPDNLDDMMVIVRELRQQRLNIMQNYSIQEPATPNNNNLNNQESSEIMQTNKSRKNNLQVTNFMELYNYTIQPEVEVNERSDTPE